MCCQSKKRVEKVDFKMKKLTLIVWVLLVVSCFGFDIATVTITETTTLNKAVGNGRVQITVKAGEVVSVVEESKDSLLVKRNDWIFSIAKDNTDWELQSQSWSQSQSVLKGADDKWKTVSIREFELAQKRGTANWEVRPDGFWVYSWSYGEPGTVWLGNLGTNQSIEATMVLGDFGPHGYTGVAVGISDPDGKNTHLKERVFLVRIRGGVVELVNVIPLKWDVLGKAEGVSLKKGDEVVLSLCVTKAKHLDVFLNGKSVISYEASAPIKGQVGVVAANGSFLFKQIQTGHGSSITK